MPCVLLHGMVSLRFLSQVYPYNYAGGRHLRVGAAIAFCTFLFLVGLEPVGVNENARFGLLITSAAYAMVAGLGFVLYFGILTLLRGWESITDRWTVGRELLLFSGLFVMVGCVNHALRPLLYESVSNYDLAALVRSIFDTFKVGLLVLGVVTTINLGHLIRSNEAQAEVVRLLLKKPSHETHTAPSNGATVIAIGTQNEQVEVLADDVVFFMASGNYVEIRTQKDGVGQRQLLRIAMKAVEEQLPSETDLVRVHRAFIVNTGRIAAVSGNAQGYQLRVNGADREIPVSRSYMSSFNAHMAERHGR